jgi:CDGSH-type Zn-finger protein
MCPGRSNGSRRALEKARITPYENGPLIVRGSFALTDQDGNEIDPGRRTIALCRCGLSRHKPFCDAMHKLTGFSAPTCGRQIDDEASA